MSGCFSGGAQSIQPGRLLSSGGRSLAPHVSRRLGVKGASIGERPSQASWLELAHQALTPQEAALYGLKPPSSAAPSGSHHPTAIAERGPNGFLQAPGPAPARPAPEAPAPAGPAPVPRTPEQAQCVSSLWGEIREEVLAMVDGEPEAGGLLHHGVTIHDSLESSMAFVLSNKLASSTLSSAHLIRLITAAYEADPSIATACAADLRATKARDVACDTYTKALLFFKGFHAIQAYRVAHWMWKQGRRDVAFDLQGRMASVFNVDIHPAAKLGSGILLDHATGIVIGQTSVVGDNVSMLHRVVLGGSGYEIGRRHPTIGDGVLLSAGVNVLGPVTVGRNSKIGAGAMVVADIPANCVAVGVPAKVIKRLDEAQLAHMDQAVEYVLDYEI